MIGVNYVYILYKRDFCKKWQNILWVSYGYDMGILWFALYFTLMRSLFCVLALFYLIEGEAALEEEAVELLFGGVFLLFGRLTQNSGVLFFVNAI